MADDINKKINIDIEINTDGQHRCSNIKLLSIACEAQ